MRFHFSVNDSCVGIDDRSFLHELLDDNPNYKLLTPFEDSPSVQHAQAELEHLHGKVPTINDFRTDSKLQNQAGGTTIR